MTGKQSSKQSLPNGTAITERKSKSGLNAGSVCIILKECRKGRDLKRLSISDTHVEIEFFEPSRDLASKASTPETISSEASPSQETNENLNEAVPPQVLLTEEDREVFREIQRAQLAIDDPIAFESMMIDEQVGHGGLSDEGNDG